MEEIMRTRIAANWNFCRKIVLAVTAIAALFGSLAIGGESLQTSPPKPAGAWAAFEAASVRPNDPAVPGRPGMFMNFGGGCGIFGLQVDARQFAVTAFPYALVSIANGKNCQSP